MPHNKLRMSLTFMVETTILRRLTSQLLKLRQLPTPMLMLPLSMTKPKMSPNNTKETLVLKKWRKTSLLILKRYPLKNTLMLAKNLTAMLPRSSERQVV